MHFEFDELQLELRQVVGAFLESVESRTQGLTETPKNTEQVWREAAELGLLGVNAPEALGGLEAGPVTLVALLEIMGQRHWSSPYLSTVAIGADALNLCGEQRWSQAIAEGKIQVSLAFLEADGSHDLDHLQSTVREGQLFGQKQFVLWGQDADLFVVVARDAEGGDLGLFAVEAETKDVKVVPRAAMDPGRPLASVSFEGAHAHRLGGNEQVEQLLHRAQLYSAAESLGGAQACLDLAVEYAKDRHQFGRPIGSFQAIQHHCAEMLLHVESARSAVYAAAHAAQHGPPQIAMEIAMAQATASEAFFYCAGTSIQVLGGIAITWEHPIHLYFKRAQGSRMLWGDPSVQRHRFVTHGGIDRPLAETT